MKELCIRVDFALIQTSALFVIVKELDRIFDGDHVLVALVVDLVEHRGEGGGLSGTGRTGDEHQAARLLAKTFHHEG